MSAVTLDLFKHQASLITDTTTRDLALIGGRGCGKTFALALKMISLAGHQAGQVGAILSPTGPMLSKVFIPDMLDALARTRIKYQYNRTQRSFQLRFGNRVSTIFGLSAENVRDGLGLNLAFFGVDEADTMKPDVAFESWSKLSATLRVGNPEFRQKVAVSTPEGFGFCYRHWVENVTDENRHLRRIIHARSSDNKTLTKDFFEDLRSQFPAHYLEAYLEGKFVNMTSGSVYPGYDADLNDTQLTLETLPDTVKTLHLGMDFNIKEPTRHPYGICVTTTAIVGGQPYTIDELTGTSRTVDAISQARDRYPGYKIIAYPDASGSSNRTSASVSDRAQLQAAGFTDLSPMGNPRVQDRVNCLNTLLHDANGNRRWKINKRTCPILSKCLTQQPYDKLTGQPEKDTGYDDPVDSVGYCLNVLYPIRRPNEAQLRLAA